jgi:predicted DNA-binding antitoxin AbrB/MazE fold protein
MSETITVIYERGVLRPLKPLALPESTRVEIQIVSQPSAGQEKDRVRQALLDAGIIQRRTLIKPLQPVSEELLAEAASALAEAGPLSDLIITERDGR